MYDLCFDDPDTLFDLLLEEEADAFYEAHAPTEEPEPEALAA